MTIEKGIEILTQQVRYYNQVYQIDIVEALKLGIEALKRVQYNHGIILQTIHVPLPGETGGKSETGEHEATDN